MKQIIHESPIMMYMINVCQLLTGSERLLQMVQCGVSQATS